MDYTGIDFRPFRFPVNRPLTDEEKAARYQKKQSRNAPPMDFLSVIKCNSTYMDLVDRWYPIKGFNVWFGSAVILASIFLSVVNVRAFFHVIGKEELWISWLVLIFFLLVGLGLGWAGWWVVRTEVGRWTHYPMRINRKTRQVHVFRQNGTVLMVPWDDLYLVRGESKNFFAGTTHDLRAHVLDKDGITVLESFSLGYATLLGNALSVDKFWAFLQPYMEAPDGVERTIRHLQESGYLAPLDGRKEGWRWSITQSFLWTVHWPWLQFLGSPFLGLNAVGRMFAMWTSKQPEWPEEVEQANKIDADDPYVLTWRDNRELGWWDFHWPLLCTVLGVSIAVTAICWPVFLTVKRFF
ncbi:DUF6708 domain-containing protein [Alcanivorax sp. 24]|uniref:DUF6708 domain-containing protein n=1 Tax=Alcanivorax sp. 24 TaxID=2545266 RepID=UPI00105E6D8C|nr:DUF6708 domain-containing protein [Alcanivorax sp. 24]